MREFCSKHGLVERSFSWWRWKLGRDALSGKDEGDVRLVPVDVVRTSMPAGEVVVVVAGIEIRVEVGTDVAYVASLATELRTRC